ncbi:phosphoribosylformylglycinamidine synthase [Hephaestia caeni]|uniref:Phosphoribosylformylglycinamidine synthase subunit PurS n=1 Tax=Hephaestia caeni TaxID=645617 RepID=A0A397NMD5_9SPHN|nr:phosphoribosylformylglycinamidine synthase subunit PurS [Hephaestia caeni]RIA36769.1 phosphoribosylformylglycinamidine synthase [Hephaestia caeni]
MKLRIVVTLKNGVLDPQGKAIHHALTGLGFTGVNDVRAGRLIELDVADNTTDEAIDEMCRKLLANTVIENYRVERASPGKVEAGFPSGDANKKGA